MIDVMIAEGMPFILEDMADAINSHSNFQVTVTAKSGAEILDLVKKNLANIVLMDIEM